MPSRRTPTPASAQGASPPGPPREALARAAGRYGLSLLLIAAAVGATLRTGEALRPAPFLLLFAAVAAAAGLGGVGAGIVSALAAALAADLFLVPPVGALEWAGTTEYLALAGLLLVAVVAGSATDAVRRTRAIAEEAADRASRTASRLRMEEQRSELILERVTDGITVQDPTGALVYANDAAARILGFPDAASLVATPPARIVEAFDLLDEDRRPVPLDALPGRRVLAGEEVSGRLLCLRIRATGEERWVNVTARSIRDERGQVLMAVNVVHDLTDRVRHEQRIEAHSVELDREREAAIAARAEAEAALGRITLLQKVTAALSETMTAEGVARVVMDEARTALGARVAMLALPGGDPGSFRLAAAHGLPGALVERWTRFAEDDPLPVAEAVRRSEPVFVAWPEAVERYPSLAAAFGAAGCRAVAAMPLSAAGRTLGVVAFAMPEASVEPPEREMFVALGRQCAQALDRARLMEAERHARALAEEASRARTEFLAVVSHELRTPLNAILGYQDLLESEVAGPMAERQHGYLARIRDSALHLLGLIEQILSLARPEAEGRSVRVEEVDAAEVARDIAALLEPHIQRKGLGLRLDLPDGGARVRTDPRALRQILLNLLSNATKFTDSGRVELRLEAREGGVSFSVRDTGAGIGDADRERIFEPFVQVQGGGLRTAGTGLGLPVARELARTLGGDITVESQAGEGSTFTVRLPGSPADEPSPPPPPTSRPRGPARRAPPPAGPGTGA